MLVAWEPYLTFAPCTVSNQVCCPEDPRVSLGKGRTGLAAYDGGGNWDEGG